MKYGKAKTKASYSVNLLIIWSDLSSSSKNNSTAGTRAKKLIEIKHR